MYVSTRGGLSGLSFCEAVTMGLASDGGLLVPESVPDISGELASFAGLDYQELAFRVMRHFVDDIPADHLESLIRKSYSTFDHPLITPLSSHGKLQVLELFHGPTLAFKDLALQFLGNVFEYILKDRDETLNLLAATSGDTGSAAIAGVRGKAGINIFVMYPEGKTSFLQEKQMTAVLDDNVRTIAVQGSFDDCQSILKAVFSDLDFKSHFHLGAVNSVNWARVLAQLVYYFSAYVQLGCPSRFQVSVPTGNFGNIFAGFIARKMGLPISHLILATNRNDILHRFFSSGRYERGQVRFSLSPAMDIQVASNLERYLHYLFDGQPRKVSAFMRSFTHRGVAVTGGEMAGDLFRTGSVSDEETVATIRSVYEEEGYLVDPHTAVGIAVARNQAEPGLPLVCLATAHPAKFDSAILRALGEDAPDFGHPLLKGLGAAESRKTVLPADVDRVKAFIRAFNETRDRSPAPVGPPA